MFRDVSFHFEIEKKKPEDLKPFFLIDKQVDISWANINLYSVSYLKRLTNVKFIGIDFNDQLIIERFPNLKHVSFVEEDPVEIKDSPIRMKYICLCYCYCLYSIAFFLGFLMIILQIQINYKSKT